MLPSSVITINWTGKQLTPVQQVIIHDAALDFESHSQDERLVFENPLCDGMIECKGRFTLGAYRGTRFLATLDSTDGKPRTYEFLLTDFHTKSDMRGTKIFWRSAPDGSNLEYVDAGDIQRTRTSSLKRSRLN